MVMRKCPSFCLQCQSLTNVRCCLDLQQNSLKELSTLNIKGNFLMEPGNPFLERPGNLMGPESYFEINVSRKVGQVLTSDEVSFVSLADDFTVQFSKL